MRVNVRVRHIYVARLGCGWFLLADVFFCRAVYCLLLLLLLLLFVVCCLLWLLLVMVVAVVL